MITLHPETLGRYQLLALLASGGMAEIYLARQTGIQGFNRMVVVKRVHPHLARDSEFLEMFFDEARIAAHLYHPNIVQILDLGHEDDQYFIAMEYLEGESLAFLVSQAKKNQTIMSHEIAAAIVSQICDGLGYAHKLCDDNGNPMNIVHRDVNPQNIIVMFSGQVKLVDFGIAKAALQEHNTRVGTLKGKLSYMSPEQCLCKELKASSDVFSLGILFWELLTHTRLFKYKTEAETINAITADEIPSVRKLQPDVPEELELIVSRALQHDPAHRYADAAEMGAALHQVIRIRNEEVGKQEISVFVEKVLGERARTKRRLLDEIRHSSGEQITLSILKPDSNVSMPNGVSARSIFNEFYDAPPVTDSDILSISATAPRRILHAVRFILPVILLIGIGIAIWWFTSGRPADQNHTAFKQTISMETENSLKPRPDVSSATDEPRSTGIPVTNSAPPDVNVGNAALVRAEPIKADLSVTSTPSGCTVQLDGIEVAGLSPIEKLPVDPKVYHVVDVICAKHQKETKKFKPSASEHVTLAFSPPPMIPAPVVATGLLRLNTKPWSEVYLKNKKLGLTPLVDVNLPAGKHTLTLINDEIGLKKTVQVAIDANRTNNLFFELK